MDRLNFAETVMDRSLNGGCGSSCQSKCDVSSRQSSDGQHQTLDRRLTRPRRSPPRHQHQQNHHRFTSGLSVVAVLIMVVLLGGMADAGSVNDCRAVRQAYSAKGFDMKDVPRQPRQGSQLQVCPRGLTCCSEDMERKLWTHSKEQFTKSVKNSATPLAKMFANRAKKFDEFFTDLLIKSKLKFHKLFQRTYGIIYERNSDVFIDFFKDLEAYYDEGKINLEDALKDFFTRLYQRMFTVFNAQHNFDSTYLSCVSQTMKKLQPFGDVPRQLTEQLRRSFVATRTFAQALIEAKQIINKIIRVAPKDECVTSLTRMTGCSTCQAVTSLKPCKDFCLNVMKGCLAYHQDLGDSWDKFIEQLQILSDRLLGAFDIEAVVVPIGLKISDAIMNFQNSGYDVTAKVFQDCGTPRLHKRQVTNYGPTQGLKAASGGTRGGAAPAAGNEETRLKYLIREIRESIGSAKKFWTRLPRDLCDENNNNKDQTCWNGMEAGRYTKNVVADGLANQEQNPEVRVEISRPDVSINEQIFALKLITKKVESAHKGQNVEWPPSTTSYMSDKAESSGDGCDPYSDDEDCYENINNNRNNYNNNFDDEEGSGSGDADNIYVTNLGGGRGRGPKPGKADADDDEEETENWPPWVTPKSDSGDISVDEMDDKAKSSSTTSTTTSTKSAAESSINSVSAVKAVVYYLVPVLTCFLGSWLSW